MTTTTIWRFEGTNHDSYGNTEPLSYMFMFGRRAQNRDRLVLRNGGTRRRVTELRRSRYESLIHGFTCDGPGEPLDLHSSPLRSGRFTAIQRVTSIMKGHADQNGAITWHRETERRLSR